MTPDLPWFKRQIEAADTSQRQIAMAIGIDPASLSHTLHGKRRLQLDEARMIADILHQPLGVVLSKAGVPADPPNRQVNILGAISDDKVEVFGRGDNVDCPADLPAGCVAFEQVTHQPLGMRGAIWFVGPKRAPGEDAPNRLCIIDDERVGYVSRTVDAGFYRIGSNEIAIESVRLVYWIKVV